MEGDHQGAGLGLRYLGLTQRDLDFQVGTVSLETRDKGRLKQIIREDRVIRNSYGGVEMLFQRLSRRDRFFG